MTNQASAVSHNWLYGVGIADCGLRIADFKRPCSKSEIRNPRSEIALVVRLGAGGWRPRATGAARPLALALILLSLMVAPAGSQQEPPAKPAQAKLTFIKQFPGSVPDYYAVVVTGEGQAEYAMAPDDADPPRFKLTEATTREIFQLVERLDRFENAQLETSKKVAFMGKKTFRYEAAGRRSETSFNYSENTDAMALVALFEKISASQQHLINLERLVRFDRLGIMKELYQIEAALDRNELIEAAQFIPVLEEIAGNSSYLHIAQLRARSMLQRIRTPSDK